MQTQAKYISNILIITYPPSGGWTLCNIGDIDSHLSPLEAILCPVIRRLTMAQANDIAYPLSEGSQWRVDVQGDGNIITRTNGSRLSILEYYHNCGNDITKLKFLSTVKV